TARVVRMLWRRHGGYDPYLHLVPRVRPEARTGKGDALNAAYRALGDWMGNAGTPPPSRNVLGRWFGLKLAQLQDLEFRTAIAAIQTSRGFTGTISMGGNGQFTRLTALDSIAGDAEEPWRGSLLEDFELGVHLLTAGW